MDDVVYINTTNKCIEYNNIKIEKQSDNAILFSPKVVEMKITKEFELKIVSKKLGFYKDQIKQIQNMINKINAKKVVVICDYKVAQAMYRESHLFKFNKPVFVCEVFIDININLLNMIGDLNG